MAGLQVPDLDIHAEQPVRVAGEPLEQARAALLMLHGRGASARDILSLVEPLQLSRVVYLAPEAAGDSWYPNRFLAPISTNEPWLSSSLRKIAGLLEMLTAAHIPPERTILLGFSQGACLALEYAVRYPRHYGGVVGLSGALIGPGDTARAATGSLAGTPVFLGCSDLDPHVPVEQVRAAADTLRRLGGEVTERIYPHMDHIVNQDETDFVCGMVQTLLAEKNDLRI
jgi:phospholipase/carboxylesterase